MGRQDFETETLLAVGGFPDHACETADSLAVGANQTYGFAGEIVAHSLRGDGFDASEDGTGRGTPLVPIAIQGAAHRVDVSSGPGGLGIRTDGVAYTLEARSEVQTVSYSIRTAQTSSNGKGVQKDVTHALDSANGLAVAFPAKLSNQGVSGGDVCCTLESRNPTSIVFDTTQITSKTCRSNPKPGAPCHTLAKGAHPPAIAFTQNQGGDVLAGVMMHSLSTNTHSSGRNAPTIAWSEELTAHEECAGTVQRGGDGGRREGVMTPNMAVRRLTPLECERLQGFPDSYTAVMHRGKPAADGPRYKALGNSWAVPCARWIAERMQVVDAIGL